MLKDLARRAAGYAGLYVASTGRIGIDPELDLARFSAEAPIATIFDVGGNFGQTATRFAEAFPSAAIYTFEPVKSSFEKLASAVAPFPRIKPFNIGMGDTAGTASINITPSAGSNSIKAVGAGIDTAEIQIRTLDDFAAENGIRSIDLLKIDVEGYELQVLEGGRRLLSQGAVRFIFAKCVLSPNDEMPHTSFFDLHKVLDAAGFCFITYYAEGFNLRLGCALGNVLYCLAQRCPQPRPEA